MAKTLVIVESPAKAKTIKKYLGAGYDVLASKGHVKDLPKGPKAVDVANDFTETYAVIEGKEKILDELKAAAKKVEAVLLATDPDREGEAIAFHIAEEIKSPKLKVERVEFNEITKRGIDHGVQNPRKLDEDLYDAQRARRVLDRIVGYDVSALVWSKLAFGLSDMGILPPTLTISKPTEEVVIDGVRFVFHDVGGTEAPSEFVFYLPEMRAFGGAELMGHTLHNLYTLRGAKVRDALKWAVHLDASLEHAAQAEVVFNQHHWPVWGQPRIREFISKQRDSYRYIHDQTVRLMNAGLNAAEIAEQLQMPPSLSSYLNVHGYYGTVRHNAKAVYQFYLGWYDANPANLDPLPPVEAGKRYVALAGGADKLLAAAQQAFEAGDFRWAAEMLKHAVYADPDNTAARELLAKNFEQLGYLAEASTWRNAYRMALTL